MGAVMAGWEAGKPGAVVFCEQRPHQHVGLHIDHHDMLARRNRRARMFVTDRRIAGCFHHHIHRPARNRAGAVVGERGGGNPRVIPADSAAGFARPVAVDVDDERHLQPRRMRHLRQKHRAELAGADQPDAEWLAFSRSLQQQTMEIHERSRTEGSPYHRPARASHPPAGTGTRRRVSE